MADGSVAGRPCDNDQLLSADVTGFSEEEDSGGSDRGQPAWRIRSLVDGDETGVLRLLRQGFGDQPEDRFSVDYWRWEYMDGDGGPSTVLLADDRGTIVGHYAASPQRFMVDGAPRTGAIVTDVLTHDDYRFQGMFTALGRSAMESVATSGIDFCFGFPVRPEVMPGHLKVGWTHAFDLPVLAFPLRFDAIVQTLTGRRFVGRLLGPIGSLAFRTVVKPLSRLTRFRRGPTYRGGVTEIRGSDPRLTDLWLRVSKQYRVAAIRDDVHLTWRFDRHPRNRYRIFAAHRDGVLDGYVAVSRSEIMGLDAGVIVDLVVDRERPGALKALIDESVRSCATEGVDLVAVMLNRRSPEYQQMRSLGFLHTPHRFHFIVFQNSESLAPTLLVDECAWWLSWGDTDVI